MSDRAGDRVDVFISYARAEQGLAEPLRQRLEAIGLTTFFDLEGGIHTGDAFPQRITHAIRDCKVVLACWTPTSLSRDWCRKECLLASQFGKLAPVALSSLTPNDLGAEFIDINYASMEDYEGQEQHFGFSEMLKAIAAKMEAWAEANPDHPDAEACMQRASGTRSAAFKARPPLAKATPREMRPASGYAGAALGEGALASAIDTWDRLEPTITLEEARRFRDDHSDPIFRSFIYRVTARIRALEDAQAQEAKEAEDRAKQEASDQEQRRQDAARMERERELGVARTLQDAEQSATAATEALKALPEFPQRVAALHNWRRAKTWTGWFLILTGVGIVLTLLIAVSAFRAFWWQLPPELYILLRPWFGIPLALLSTLVAAICSLALSAASKKARPLGVLPPHARAATRAYSEACANFKEALAGWAALSQRKALAGATDPEARLKAALNLSDWRTPTSDQFIDQSIRDYLEVADRHELVSGLFRNRVRDLVLLALSIGIGVQILSILLNAPSSWI